MNTLTFKWIAVAASLVCATGASAQSLTSTDFKLAKTKIASDYKLDRTHCSTLSDNAKDICVEEAKGKQKVARAELDVLYTPTINTRYRVRVAKAEADYEVAKERCDDLAGNAKDVCVKQVKANWIAAKADAKVQMKTSDANATADEKTADALTKANGQVADAKKDARLDKRDAEYSVAKEKCDTFAGSVKDDCLQQAKTRFGPL